MKLFKVSILREHSEAHKLKWSGKDETYSHLEWRDSEEAVWSRWAETHARPQPYWDERFKDSVVEVVEATDVAARREAAARYTERCCELAVLNPCVCRVSFICPEHGTSHWGTHD